ncbi:MAG: ABC transporter permease [Actinomycetota bacterium]|nr:ABC transporter permease [Actinomycetota bacterium]
MPSIVEDRVHEPGTTSEKHAPAPPSPATDGGDKDSRPPRTARGLLLLPPWIRAPMLGLRQPGAFFAVAVAAAILACAAASAALFLSSASSASLQQQINDRCDNAAYPMIGTQTYLGPFFRPENEADVRPAFTPQTDRAYPEALAGQGMDSNPVFIGASSLLRQTGQERVVRPFYRPGAVDEITVLDSRPGAGVYLPSFVADYARVGVGDSVAVAGASVLVVGVYQNLYDEPVRDFWCSYSALFNNETNANTPPADIVIATDEATFYALATAHDNQANSQGGFGAFDETALRMWEVPVDPDSVTRTSAAANVARQDTAFLEARSISGDLTRPGDFREDSFQSEELGMLLDRSQRLENGLRGPVIPTAVAGTILAMLLVMAAGSYWADRRLREVRLLSSRGVGPGALAVKAALELVIPAALGTVAGYYLARGLIALAGPADDLDPDALRSAILTTIAGFVIGLILLSAVAGIRSRNFTEKPIGHKRSWLSLLPYELLLLGTAGYLWWQLQSQDAVLFDGTVAQVNGLLVSFPLLFLAGAAVLVVRLIMLVLPALRRRAQGWSPAAFVAVNQLTANRVVSASLLAALCLPIAVLTYSATLTASSQRTVDSKALTAVGAERAVTSFGALEATPAVDAAGTLVARYQDAFLDGAEATALGVDPDDFASEAYWEDSFAGQNLEELLALLVDVDGDRVPVIAAGGIPLGPIRLDLGGNSLALTLEAEVVAVADVLPGRRTAEPLILLDDRLVGAEVPQSANLRYEIWTNGDPEPAAAEIREQDARLFRVFTTTEVFELANFLGVSWTFGYLQALAAFVGVIAIGGLLLYLETRQRKRTASYAMARRMGLTRWTHFRSLLAELGSVLAVAGIVGVGLAAAACTMAYRRLDVDPIREPSPLLAIPWITLAAIAVAAIVVAFLTAVYAQRRSDRVNPAEVLRLGG